MLPSEELPSAEQQRLVEHPPSASGEGLAQASDASGSLERNPPRPNDCLTGSHGRPSQREGEQVSPTVENVLPFYLRKANTGQRVCLVTLFNVDTVSPRPLGSQIAVSEDGESFGFITGGCAEAAIVHEALLSLKENRSRTIRIGSDSPWFDIKLPCGAGIDIHFSVADSRKVIQQSCQQLANRKPVTLAFDRSNDQVQIVAEAKRNPKSNCETFFRQYNPTKRLIVIGAGPYVAALESMAKLAEFEVSCWSPEFDSDQLLNAKQHSLSRSTTIPTSNFDPWTAAVLLFHEHDWEPKLLQTILNTDCFYIGTLGSRKTHADRLQWLREMGVSETDLHRIRGPIGLAINAQTPAEIALSILSEIVLAYRSSQ